MTDRQIEISEKTLMHVNAKKKANKNCKNGLPSSVLGFKFSNKRVK